MTLNNSIQGQWWMNDPCVSLILLQIFSRSFLWICHALPGDPKKKYLFLGFQVDHRCMHSSQFQYFPRFHCQKKYTCNSAELSPTELLQISSVEIIVRLTVDILLTENKIFYHNQFFEGSNYIYCSNQQYLHYYSLYLVLTKCYIDFMLLI